MAALGGRLFSDLSDLHCTGLAPMMKTVPWFRLDSTPYGGTIIATAFTPDGELEKKLHDHVA